ncbi:MAG: hypothetical protein IJ226_03460 [Clostridia bacterium]|nr:hypothetical protein [Clostridia bacterium]
MRIEDARTKKPFEKIRESKIVAKLKGIKNIQIIVAILIIAVALIIYSNVIGKTGTKEIQSASSVMTEEETRLSAVLSQIDGAGAVSAMITKHNDETVGVIVICEGAKDISVRLRVLDATATALGVDKSIVSVYSKST